MGTLGLTNPIVKAKALLIKTMYKDFLEHDCSITDDWIVNSLYGYNEDFIKVYSEGLSTAPVKQIYNFLLQDEICRNGSLIPSRNEKKSPNVKWGLVWKNLSLMKGLIADEKCFAWKMSQDILPVGSRIHRRNAERRCLTNLSNGEVCFEIQTMEHLFSNCKMVENIYGAMKRVLEIVLDRSVSYTDIIHFSFNHRNKKKLKLALWFSVKMMFKIYQDKCRNKAQLLKDVIKTIDWNLSMNRKLGSLCEVMLLKATISTVLENDW